MITVTINSLGDFPLDHEKIKRTISSTLEKEGIVTPHTVSVAIVNGQEMDELVKKHYKDDPNFEYDHPILTFPNNEATGEFVDAPEQIPSLGEIILSYDSIVERAKDSGKSHDAIAESLAEHGAHHLLGHHH